MKNLFTFCLLLASVKIIHSQSQNWWRVNGNTPSSSDFIGTTNNTNFIFKTNNITRFSINANGDINFNNFISSISNRILSVDNNGKLSALSGTAITSLIESNGSGMLSKSGADYYLPSGNLGLGITPSLVFKLDVLGNTRFNGNLILTSGSNLSAENTTVNGTFKNTVLASSGGDKIVMVDEFGNFKTAPSGGPNVNAPGPCVSGAIPWYEGGNNLPTNNSIGTCDANDFVLKSNNVLSQWIKPSGSIGFGANFTSNPGDPLQFVFSNGLTRCKGNNVYGGPMFVFDGPTSPNGDWGIEYTGGTTTSQAGLNFWKPFGSTNANNNILFLHDNNNIGIATDNPTARLTIESWSNDGIKMTTDNLNSKALSLNYKDLGTGNVSEYFSVNANGYTDIKVYSPLAMPKPYGAPTNERVFTIRDMNGNKDLFAITSKGLVYAREVEINLTGTFPDYVFANNYKLKPLSEVDAFIKANKHLPNFEKGSYYEKNGINVTDLMLKQQQTIEELMLYNIELEKRLKVLEEKK